MAEVLQPDIEEEKKGVIAPGSMVSDTWVPDDKALTSIFPNPVAEDENLFIERDDNIENVLSIMSGVETLQEVQIVASNLDNDRRARAITAASYSFPNEPSTFANLAKGIINAPLPKYTDGEAVAQNIKHPEHIKQEVKKLGTDLDIAIAKNTITNSAVKNLNGTSYKQVFETPDKAIYQTAENLVKNNPDGLKKLKSISKPEDFTFNGFFEVLEHVNPIGGASEEGMDLELWEMTKDIFTGDFEYDEFDKKMESNWGEDWGSRFGWFVAKEAGFDAGLLMLAMSGYGAPLAGVLKVARTASLGLRFKAAMGRALVVGIGGGGAQAGQNAMLDRDLNIGSEMITRTVGYAGLEGLVKLAGMGVRRLRGSTLDDAIKIEAKESGVKPLSKTALKKAVSKFQFEDSAFTAVVMSSLNKNVANFNKLMDDTATSILQRREAAKSELLDDTRERLSKLMGFDKDALENIEIDILMAHVTKLGNKYEKTALPMLRNQNAASKGLAYRMLGMSRGEYETFTRDFELHFDDLNLMLRRWDIAIAKSNNSVVSKMLKGSRLTEPVNIAFQSASNYLTARNFSTKIANSLQDMYKHSVKGLNKEELNVLDTMLKEGDTQHKIFDSRGYSTASSFDPMKISDKVHKAYVKARFSMDVAYEILDKAKVNAFGGKLDDIRYGKVYKIDDKFFQVVGKSSIGKGSTDTGKWRMREFDTDSLSAVGDKEYKFLPSKFKEIDTIIPYRNGHIPRVYRPHKYSVVVFDPATNATSREFMTDSGQEAAEYMTKRQAVAGNQVVMKFTNNSDTGFSGFKMNRNSMNILNAVSESEREILAKNLIASGLKPSDIQFMTGAYQKPKTLKAHTLPQTELGTAVTKKGAELRLKLSEAIQKKKSKDVIGDIKEEIVKELKASAVPAREAIVDYFGTVAHNAGYDNWRLFAVDDWMKRYGKHVDNLNSSSYADPKFNPGTASDIVKEAERYGKWIERNVTNRTFTEKKYDQFIARWQLDIADKAAKGSISAKAITKLADKIPLAHNIYGNLRFIAAQPKLLMLNIPQIVVQGSQVIVSLSAAAAKSPQIAVSALYKVPMLGIIAATQKLGGKLPRAIEKSEIFKLYKELKDSGYASDLMTTDTIFGMRNNLDPHIGAKLWSSIKTIGASPFRLGEGFNRVSAYVVTRELLIHDMNAFAKLSLKAAGGLSKKEVKELDRLKRVLHDDFNPVEGTYIGIKDGKVDKSIIGSHQFRETVVNKASTLALNMGKAGELEAMSGPGSVFLQFKQVLPKEISVFDSSLLTTKEKVFAATGMMSFWGVAGIPLAADILNVTDWFVYSKDDPKSRFLVSDALNSSLSLIAQSIDDGSGGFISKEFTENLVKRGGIAALSDNEINFISRVALGNFVTEMVDVNDPFDYVVSFAVLSDMVDAVDRITGIDLSIAAKAGVVGGLPTGIVAGVVSEAEKSLNIVSFLEVLSRVKAGQSFQFAFGEQFEPDSVIGKYIAGNTSIGNALLETLREVGKVYSQAGSVSRGLDANFRDIVQPDAYMASPGSIEYYTSSNLTGIPVERNFARDLQLYTGFTPGKIVEEYNKQDLQRMYNTAMMNYKDDIKKRYRRSHGDYYQRTTIRNEASRRMSEFREHMDALGLDNTVPKNIMNSLMQQWFGIEKQTFTGGKLK